MDVPLNSWWSDSGATFHLTNDLQDLGRRLKPREDEASIVVAMELKHLEEPKVDSSVLRRVAPTIHRYFAGWNRLFTGALQVAPAIHRCFTGWHRLFTGASQVGTGYSLVVHRLAPVVLSSKGK
ncbi:hypothetical protein HAX54_002970 [Datura stramonium]|uniref:Uncharacterized protein n=1 Tax=Datura stramonium TaxID=4076 RepID=A0ABS8WTW9_DATST|nr:hypothetical protein [Datura stramonium]